MTIDLVLQVFITAGELLAAALRKDGPTSEANRDKILDVITKIHLANIEEDVLEIAELDGD